MKFNTAILYDIENLIGGYGKTDMLSSLSLRDIYNEILKKDIGGIAIQRAYANWSNPKLNVMRGDVVELGIEPIQMFGFGRGSQKNASDIQLAIDAVDIAFTKSAVEIFIIVSGDGGFSSLAKKLHEYGKMVIGCAYTRNTNRVFEAVCDDFIWIEDSHDEYSNGKNVTEFTDPLLIDFAKRFEPVEAKGEEIIKQTRQIFDFFAGNKEAAYLLKNAGLNISILSQALSYRIIDFNYATLGFTKFTDFIRYAVSKSELKLVLREPSEYRLLFKNSKIKGFETVEPIMQLEEMHTPEKYKALLAKGDPSFSLPGNQVIFDLTRYLAENKLNYQAILFGDIIEDLGERFPYEQKDIKNCVRALISAGCFMKENNEARLSEQKLFFIFQSFDHAIEALRKAMHDKLEALLGQVKEDIFAEIIK